MIASIYRHPTTNPAEFNDAYLSDLLQKISKEDTKRMSMDDLNIHLLKYDANAAGTVLLDSMYTIFFLPYIKTLSLITTHSETLIGNIFLNKI